MCTKDAPVTASVQDGDVWASDSSDDHDHGSSGNPAAARTQLDREWEARKQQFYNTGYRQGIDKGKEVTLQHGFNAGFSEGARAGYEFGLVRGAVQTLAAQLAATDPRHAKVQDLQQQLGALSARVVMQDTCEALLAQQPAEIISRHLEAAVRLEDGALPEPAAPAGEAVATSAPAAPAPSSGGEQAASVDNSSSGLQAPVRSLPQQLVAHMQQELKQLNVDIGAAPPLAVAATPVQADSQAAT